MNEVKLIHRQAMDKTDLALDAKLKGESDRALSFFREAFELESRAAYMLANDSGAEPTRSVLLRSAASLALDCNLLLESEKLICTALIGSPPDEIAEELRDLLEQVHFMRHLELRGVALQEDEIQMSIAGKAVGYGIAPTNVFLERVENTETLLYRTAERKQQKPYRDRGRREKRLSEEFELYMTAPRAASFAVTFRVGRNEQFSLPGFSTAEEVIDELLQCLEIFARGDEDQLKNRIQEEAYYRNFVGLARSIAPDGRDVDVVGFTTLRRGELKKVAMTGMDARAPSPAIPSIDVLQAAPLDKQPIIVQGVLKLADSTKDKNEIQIVDANEARHVIVVPPGMMSDIVKPLWDTTVIVTGTISGKKIILQEIRPVPSE
jgi:hypothetical protein